MKTIKACIIIGLAIATSAALAQTPVPVKVIDTGTIAGEALKWVAATFGTTIGTVGTLLIVRLLNNAGIIGANLLSDKLQRIIVNGLNTGAQQAATALQGKGKIEIQNAAVATAITYVQDHGAATIKALGLDPSSAETVDAIKARIATAIADPTTPTHPIMQPSATNVT